MFLKKDTRQAIDCFMQKDSLCGSNLKDFGHVAARLENIASIDEIEEQNKSKRDTFQF